MIYLRGDADKPLGGLYLRSQDSKVPSSGAVTGTITATATPATASLQGSFDDGSAPTRIIDHTNFDPASRSLGEIQAAAALDVYLEHASTGEDIVGDSDVDSSTGTNFNDSQSCGMALLYAADNRFVMSRESFDYSNDYTWFASNNGLQSNMRGNPTPATKISDFFGMSANMRAAVDVALFKFCWIDVWDGSGYNGTTPGYISDGAATANSIISQTVAMEAANPGLVVPLVTMPLQADESYAQRQIFNDTMRAYAEANNHWLWDFADIESHSPAGVITLDGNGREVTYPSYAYVDGGHLSTTGAERLARSFWQLLIAISQDLPETPITGTIAATATPATAAMSGEHTPPAFTGTIGAVATPATASLSGSHSLPGVSGTLDAVATPATAAMSGAHAPPGVSGTLNAVATPATASMIGTFAEQEVFQVSAALTLQPLELAATLDFSYNDSIMIQANLSLQGLRLDALLLFREIYIPVYRRGRMDVMERSMSNSKLTLFGRNGAIVNTAFEELNEYSQAMNWAVQWPTAAKLDISSASAADTGVAVTAAATMTIASPTVVTQTTHGLATGSEVSFTTTGALPVGVVAGTLYYAGVINANTFNLHPTLADAIAGTNAINTSGTQSGTHTMSERATGANKILVWGLDGNGDLQYEEVTLAGQTVVETTKTFLRVFGAEVTACGTGGVNAGNIHIVRDGTGGSYTTGVPGTLTSAALQVPAGKGCAGSGMVTIPRGYRGRLVFLSLASRAQAVLYRLLTQPLHNPQDNSAHADIEWEVGTNQSIVLGAGDLAPTGIEWQPMTDVRAQGQAATAGGIGSIHAVIQLFKV